MTWTPHHMQDNQEKQTPKPSVNPFKWVLLGVGGIVAVAHIGILGHMMKITEKYADKPQYPNINLPTGEYSSYDVKVDKEGYKLRYNANDPKTLTTTKSLSLDKDHKEKGWFGKTSEGSEVRSEYTTHEYTMEGYRNLQGGEKSKEGKLSAEKLACIKAEGSGQSTGAMVGSSMTAGIAPALTAIPYVGWLAAGWAVMLGQNVGGDIGGEIAKEVSGC